MPRADRGVQFSDWLAAHVVSRNNARPAGPSGNWALHAMLASTCANAKRAIGFCLTQDALLFHKTEESPSEAYAFTDPAIPRSLAIETNSILASAVPENIIQLPFVINSFDQKTRGEGKLE